MRICGVDEAGRGPLAGPVVAAAVILPRGYSNCEIRDSKLVSPADRERLAIEIKRIARAWAVVAVGPRRIEAMNILEATKVAMALAVYKVDAQKALIDGNQPIPVGIPQKTVVGGDGTFLCIAAASILAKTARDAMMVKLAQKFPLYGFERHMGYGTAEHRHAIVLYGPCKIHRRTFAGIREFFTDVAGSNEDLVLDLQLSA